MNKAELVRVLASDLGLSKAAAERTLNALLAAVARGLRKSGRLSLVGFGAFRVSPVKARPVVNPRTGRLTRTRAGRTVRFRAGKSLRKGL